MQFNIIREKRTDLVGVAAFEEEEARILVRMKHVEATNRQFRL